MYDKINRPGKSDWDIDDHLSDRLWTCIHVH